MLQLFPDEKQIELPPKLKGVILTTHRIAYEHTSWGRAYNQSIMLEHITSNENNFKSQLWLLILGGIFFAMGLITAARGIYEPLKLEFSVALISALIYWLTKSNTIQIGSPSTMMSIPAKSLKREDILAFLNLVEQTKHKRILALVEIKQMAN